MFPSNTPNKAISLVAKTFLLRRSGTYKGQLHRNYTANARMGQVGALIDTINSHRLTTITPTLLGTVGHDLISLDTAPVSTTPIAVPGGWNEKRGIFMLVLEATMSTGGRLNYYIQGYTDHDSFTDQFIDPNMRLYINNVVTAVPSREQTQMGTFNSMRVASNFQTPVDFGTGHGFSPTPMVMARPQDIFCQMKNNDLSSHDVFVTDRGNEISNNLVSTRRRNSLPTSFMSAVFNGYTLGRRETDQADFTAGDVAENAFTQVMEKDAITDIFLRKLQESNGLMRGQSHFTYSELSRVVPNIDQVKVPFQNSAAGIQLSQEGDSNHFAGQTISTLAAVQLGAAVPALMLESMLSTVSIVISNMVGGQLDVVPNGNIGCFAPDIAQRQFELFRNRLLTEVVNPLTERGQINIHATITCSFHSEFVCDIRMADDPNTRFVAPSFCDSLFTPTVTSDPNVVRQLSNHLSVMCDHISEAVGNAELRKDAIISRQLTAPMSGALVSDDRGFAIPGAVNSRPLSHLAAHAPIGAGSAMDVRTAARPGAAIPTGNRGPSMNSM